MATGTAILAFGASPVDNGTFTITDAGVSAASFVEAFFQGNDSTVGAQANDTVAHEMAAACFANSACIPTAGQFDVVLHTMIGLVTGDLKIRYVYSP